MIDHLIFAAPTLETGNDIIKEKLGVRPVFGGRHLGYGTHNALLKIGPQTYLEVIAPDPAQGVSGRSLWMGLHDVQQPGLIWWAAKGKLPESVLEARALGWKLGPVKDGSRVLENGNTLRWKLTDPFRRQENGVLPFLIDWDSGPHPADNLADSGIQLVDFQLLHPEPERIASYLAAVAPDIPVTHAATPSLRIGLSTPLGTVYL